MSEKLFLVDGNSIINRAFYALPLLTNKDGEYTNAIYGFLNMFFKFTEEEKPDYVAVAFDLPAPTFRHLKYENYKGNRKSMPDELRPQIILLKKLLKKMNINVIEVEGFEADDILGTLGKKGEEKNFDVTILSGDRDLLQIASNKIKIKIPKTKSGKTIVEEYFEKDVIEQIGVTPTEYIDVKALMGDASDNIPGVPSIGEKTALKIIKEYKTIENAIKNYENIKPKKASENLKKYEAQGILSKELATIFTDVKIDLDYHKFIEENIYNEEAFEEIKKLEFKNLISRFNTYLSGNISEDAKNFEFKIIKDLKQVDNYLEKLLKEKLIAYNLVEVNKKIVGISFCHENDDGTFIVFDNISEDKFIEKLKIFFESDIKKIALNSKKDKVYLNFYNINIENIIFDTMVAGYILNASKDNYEYYNIALDFLNENYLSEEELFGKGRKRKEIDEIDELDFINFSCRQSNIIFRSYPLMKNILKENQQEELYFNIELPLIDVLKDMETLGIKINKEELLKYQKDLDVKVKKLTEEIYDLSNQEFNINSPKQLGIVLFEDMELKGGKKTKTGYSTGHDILVKIENQHEIIPKVLEYRTISKLKSTYADGLLNVLNPVDNKIYSTFNQIITTTGRISSTEPNLQNIPIKTELGRELRKAFVPSSEEYIFLGGDYSQIELRVLASISEDETLINAFNENQDIHKLTASQVFNIPLNEITNLQRSNAKAVNFGIVYGIGAFSLSEDLKISRKEASLYIEGYFEKYPNVKKYLEQSILDGKKFGYGKTLFNRRRNIPELNSKNFIQRSFGERVAMNMPIQGTAADIIKIAMVKVHNRIKKENLDAKLILQVHDELLLEVNKNQLELVKEIIKYEMENATKLKVKLEVDLYTGENWYDTK